MEMRASLRIVAELSDFGVQESLRSFWQVHLLAQTALPLKSLTGAFILSNANS